ncbi:MAG TPA: type I 3-dehydroquinate dehydratase [Tepidisphaeraceae bacterium]|jgi:3-dehydroquinate dehydratase/shikimate dehydrogenase|nr:type I 3-dehydroquinate dehydratase [Tepidisphaeraceae bacterium]
MTYLCVPIFVTDEAQARREIATAAEAGADLVELRIDEFEGDPSKMVDHSIVPTVLTYRAEWEGGRSQVSDAQRAEVLTFNAHLANHTDVELETLRRTGTKREEFGSSVIVSFHDFKGRPDRLYNILTEMDSVGANVRKIVWMARSIRDNLEAFEILQQRGTPTIALCMGEAGIISRVLAKKFGAFLTFASLRDESATAPGQVTIHDMKRLYRWDAINENTKVYGVVAQPVMHSMSPAIHNAAFERVGHDGVYLPMLVNAGYESFKAFMESFLAFEPLHLSGLSVTLPHKENALRYLKEKGAEVEDLAERIGAVNTIIIERTGGRLTSARSVEPSLRGINTDYAAILDSITDKLGITREHLKDYRVAVIGAGGTGRTAVAALAHYGATVVVYNRTFERAEELAKEFNGHSGKVVAARMEKLCDSCCQIYINTTSVGMHPKVDESPFGDTPPKFTSDTVVFDTIYNPMKTKLLQHAEQSGAKTIGGVEMFVRQAAAQFEAWTNKPAHRELMRQTIEARLQK